MERDELHRSEELEGAADHLGAAGEHTQEAGQQMGKAARHTKEAMQAGASGTMEHARDAAAGAGRAVGSAAETARDAVADAGRAVGRTVASGASGAASVAGSAAGALRSSVATAVGSIASKVGGWWNSARDALPELPGAQLEACQTQYEAYALQSEEFTAEVAATAYALGYLAAQNPGYEGRAFDSVEPDLRHGFYGETGTYHAWRDFSRYGYESGARI